MIKAIFFDIDGTLISSKTHKMSAATVTALKQLRKNGIKLFVATGRPKSMVEFIRPCFEFDAYITLNGQYCFNSTEIIHKHFIPKDDIIRLIDLLKAQRFPCLFIEEQDMYINFIDEAVERHCAMTNQPLPRVCTIERALENNIYQFVAYLGNTCENILTCRLKHIQPLRAAPMCIDAIPKGGGKTKGMAAVLEHYNILRTETMAFGDGNNDIDMLQFVTIGAAMGNASDEVKAHADYVTDAVEEDGVAKGLKRFGLV